MLCYFRHHVLCIPFRIIFCMAASCIGLIVIGEIDPIGPVKSRLLTILHVKGYQIKSLTNRDQRHGSKRLNHHQLKATIPLQVDESSPYLLKQKD